MPPQTGMLSFNAILVQQNLHAIEAMRSAEGVFEFLPPTS